MKPSLQDARKRAFQYMPRRPRRAGVLEMIAFAIILGHFIFYANFIYTLRTKPKDYNQLTARDCRELSKIAGKKVC